MRTLRRLRRGVARRIDRSWPLGIFLVGAAVSVAISARATRFWDKPDLIGRLDPTTRGILYGSLATSAGALLGLTIASIAILLTLDPARERVHDMQSIPAWSILNTTLLTAAGFFAATLLFSTIALGVDGAVEGNGIMETAVAAFSIVAFLELVVGGAAFAIVVNNVTSSDT